jgi:hypothetical protein
MLILDMTTVISPTVLGLQIFEMDERLRGENARWVGYDFRINSARYPELNYYTLFLRGADRHLDNTPFLKEKHGNHLNLVSSLYIILDSFANSANLKNIILGGTATRKVSFKYRTHRQPIDNINFIIKYITEESSPSAEIINNATNWGLLDNLNGAVCTRHKIYTEEVK